MRNLLPKQYIRWLNQFKKTCSSDYAAQKTIRNLIDELTVSDSFEQLEHLLSEILTVKSNDESCYYGPINLLSQLTSWQKDIQYIQQNHTLTIRLLADTQLAYGNNSVVTILQAILTQSMHANTRSLMSIITNERFAELLIYLASLKSVPVPEKPRPGSFAAIKPYDEHHAQCIALLNNLSAVFDESNPLWSLGNSVLQVSILAYEDLHLDEEINGDQTEAEFRLEKETGQSCTLI